MNGSAFLNMEPLDLIPTFAANKAKGFIGCIRQRFIIKSWKLKAKKTKGVMNCLYKGHRSLEFARVEQDS